MVALHSVLAVLHALAGAAWFGAMFYSYSVLHPRGQTYFRDPQDFETFIATISQGARWKVLGAFAVVFISGLGLLWFGQDHLHDNFWLGLMAAKLLLFAITLCVFCYASWVLWPRRIFATPEEIAPTQRKFRTVARLMLVLIGLSFALGVLAHIV